MIATEAHGKKTEKTYLWHLFFRVLPWLLNKSGIQLYIIQHTLLSG
jgi:hypothetical protein